jgi:ATP-dependent RNA helicase DeaD
MNFFEKHGIGNHLVKAISEMGFETPTPVQQQAIPVLVGSDTDLVGLAQTGTGKTAAFGLPLLQRIDFNESDVKALILSPTRELCMQIAKDLANYSKYMKGVRITAVYGGASIRDQISSIKKGSQIIVATPGRLMDLMERRAINIGTVEYVVLDEADEMLNMGFRDDIAKILSDTPSERLTWMFSATMPKEVREIAQKFMHKPHELSGGKVNKGAENLEHMYYVTHAKNKYDVLKRIVDFNPDIFGIVFCRTRIETQLIAEQLGKDGYDADSLHGDLSQQQRDKVMKRFRDKSLQLLVATDVAARGIDVNNVTHILHYDLPDEIGNYIHRSGRTARAGNAGISIAIINMRETGKIRQLEKTIGTQFTRHKIPDGVKVCEKQLIHLIKKLKDAEVNENKIGKYLPSILAELEGLSREDLIKKFTSVEFNRFIDYYHDAPDLNAEAGEKGRGDRRNDDQYAASGERLFINLGSLDGFDRPAMAKFIATVTELPVDQIQQIDVKGVYSFFNVEPALLDKVRNSFEGEKFNSRPVRIEQAAGKPKYGRSGGGGEGRGGGFGGGGSRGGGFGGRRDEGRSRSGRGYERPTSGRRERPGSYERSGGGSGGGGGRQGEWAGNKGSERSGKRPRK